jgi:hypothetical protein
MSTGSSDVDGQAVRDHVVLALNDETTAPSNSASNPWSTRMAAEPTCTTSDASAARDSGTNLAN